MSCFLPITLLNEESLVLLLKALEEKADCIILTKLLGRPVRQDRYGAQVLRTKDEETQDVDGLAKVVAATQSSSPDVKLTADVCREATKSITFPPESRNAAAWLDINLRIHVVANMWIEPLDLQCKSLSFCIGDRA